MLNFLKEGKRIINVDETWINELSFLRKTWIKSDFKNSRAFNSVSPALSMIAALDNEGKVYFSLNHSSTDQEVFMTFMRHLVRKLDEDSPGWEDDTIILLDNASYHRGEEI